MRVARFFMASLPLKMLEGAAFINSVVLDTINQNAVGHRKEAPRFNRQMQVIGAASVCKLRSDKFNRFQEVGQLQHLPILC